MSFLVSAEQFKKAFEEENLNERFMNDLLSYLKKHLYIKRLRKMYDWITSGGQLSVFSCRTDLVEIMAEKMNLSKVPFVIFTDREGNKGFIIKEDSKDAIKTLIGIIQEEHGVTCEITSMDGLKQIIGTSKHQSKGLISITGLTTAQLLLLEDRCIHELNPEAIGEDLMEDGTYRLGVHGKSAIKKRSNLGLCLFEMALETNGKNAKANIEKADKKMRFCREMSENFGLEKNPSPVYITGNDNQYMKITSAGFDYGHAVKENGSVKFIKENTFDSGLPDYDEQKFAILSRFSNAGCTRDVTEATGILGSVLSANFISIDERDVASEEHKLAGMISDMVLKKTAGDPIMQSTDQYSSKTAHIVSEMGKVLAGLIEGDTPPGYDQEDMNEILTSGFSSISMDDYASLPDQMRQMEITAVDDIFEKVNVRETLNNIPVIAERNKDHDERGER